MSIKLKGNLIILIAGGTGGHMYPAIAILEEIKKTSNKEHYFGAATLTEWVCALENKSNYFFVVALSLGNQKWEFTEYTPEEFIKYSTIPPFKIFFRVPISEKEKSKKRRNISAVTVSEDKINKLKKVYDELKRDQD